MEHELKRILDGGRVPDDLTITYDDMHGLWGGTTITVCSDGSVQRQTRHLGSSEAEVIHQRIERHELMDLVGLLIQVAAWEQHTPEGRPLPDESRAYLTIHLKGDVSRIWERHTEMEANNRVLRIRTLMEQLSKRNGDSSTF